MTSETIYKRYTASCLQCRSEVSMQNFSKHLDSKQCKKGGKYTAGLRAARNSLNCIHCDKLCNTINSLAQHEIRCKENSNKIPSKPINNHPTIPPTPCIFCEKLFTTKSGLSNHTYRCKNNPNRKLQAITVEGKIAGKKKHAAWAKLHYADQSNRDKVSKRMKQAVNEHPESYTSSNRGRTKQIIYNDIKFQGQWELDFYMWCETNSISVIRPTKWFDYKWNGNRKYNPDFYLPDLDVYVEVKGYETDRDQAKWNHFPDSLCIIKSVEIESIRKGKFSLPLLLTKKWCAEQGSNL